MSRLTAGLPPWELTPGTPHGAPGRPDTGRAPEERAAPPGAVARGRHPDRRRPGRSPQARHRPPRPEARERDAHEDRGAASGLRAGAAHEAWRATRCPGRHLGAHGARAAHREGDGPRDVALHGAGAGRGPASGRADRSLGPGADPLRDAHRVAGLRGVDSDEAGGGDPGAGAGAACGASAPHAPLAGAAGQAPEDDTGPRRREPRGFRRRGSGRAVVARTPAGYLSITSRPQRDRPHARESAQRTSSRRPRAHTAGLGRQERAGSPLWFFDTVRQTSRALTRGGLAASPDWSPDGTQLVAGWTESRGQHVDLWLFPAEGGAEKTRLTEGAGPDWAPTWSSDGCAVVFVRGDWRHPDIYLYNFDEGQAISGRLAACSR